MYTTILVPLDGSDLSQRALPIAVSLAQASGAKLVLVHAVWSVVAPGLDGYEPEQQEIEQGQAYLESVVARLHLPGVQVETAVPYGDPPKEIAIEAQARQADLIVMCTHGRSGLGRWFFGSVAESVLQRTSAPVLLVRPVGNTTMEPFQRGKLKIVVPLDGTRPAEAALSQATELARLFDASLLLLRVLVPFNPGFSDGFTYLSPEHIDRLGEEASKAEDEAAAYLTQTAERLREDGLAVETSLRIGDEPETITIEARASGAQLVVMAPHERTGSGGLKLGRVALGVLRQGTLPVLLVHPEEESAEPLPADELLRMAMLQ